MARYLIGIHRRSALETAPFHQPWAEVVPRTEKDRALDLGRLVGDGVEHLDGGGIHGVSAMALEEAVDIGRGGGRGEDHGGHDSGGPTASLFSNAAEEPVGEHHRFPRTGEAEQCRGEKEKARLFVGMGDDGESREQEGERHNPAGLVNTSQSAKGKDIQQQDRNPDDGCWRKFTDENPGVEEEAFDAQDGWS